MAEWQIELGHSLLRRGVRVFGLHRFRALESQGGRSQIPPNQALEPTSPIVTHPADAGCAPIGGVAHLGR